MTALTLFCYGKPVGQYDDEQAARQAGEEHIRTCPEGPMPWARQIRWHSEAGSLLAAANGEWLDHRLSPTEGEPAS